MIVLVFVTLIVAFVVVGLVTAISGRQARSAAHRFAFCSGLTLLASTPLAVLATLWMAFPFSLHGRPTAQVALWIAITLVWSGSALGSLAAVIAVARVRRPSDDKSSKPTPLHDAV